MAGRSGFEPVRGTCNGFMERQSFGRPYRTAYQPQTVCHNSSLLNINKTQDLREDTCKSQVKGERPDGNTNEESNHKNRHQQVATPL